MNDRMYELINQCFIGTTDGKLSELNTVADVEKFAELIVKECAELAREWEDDYVVEDTAPFHSDVKIKKHFGVE